MRLFRCCITLSLFILGFALLPKVAKADCNTFLSRVAKKEANKFMNSKGHAICSGLKKGPIGIDKTREFKLRKLEVCEDGDIASAEAEVYIKCATSNSAVIKASVADTISAKVVANLKLCRIEETKIRAQSFFGKLGIVAADLEAKLKAEALKGIKEYCN